MSEIVFEDTNNRTISHETRSIFLDKDFCPERVHCNKCSEEHAPNSFCANWKCGICYKVHHPTYCPYFRHIPQGAPYDRENYYIVCGCCNDFDEDRWACTSCGASWAMLHLKHCSICMGFGHNEHECPKDKVRAAKIKKIRDQEFAAMAQRFPVRIQE
ncbi:hypothetical protein ACHQM5_007522 [Ranunculus cassubicifolius]